MQACSGLCGPLTVAVVRATVSCGCCSGALVLNVVKQSFRDQDHGYDMLTSWSQRICTYVRTQSTLQPCEIQVMVMDMATITRVTGAGLWVL